MKTLLTFMIFIAALFSPLAGAARSNFISVNGIAAGNEPGDRHESKEFNVKAGGHLDLNLKTGGSIKIEGWEKEVVSVELKIGGRDADKVSVSMDQNGNDISVKTESKEKHGNNNANVSVTVRMPNKFNVDFSTMGGEVEILQADGKIKGKTMGGEMNFRNLKGYLEVTSMGGGITLKDSEVDGRVKTMGGEVLVENVKGDVDASSMGGSVKQINVTGKKSEGKEVDISTMGGDLNIDKAQNGVKLKTMGGNITVNHAEKYVKAETMGGFIKIHEVDGWIKANTMGGNVEAKMIGNPAEGNRDVKLTSMGGDITLTVPAGLSMDINIEITYDSKHSDCKIVSDFTLTEERPDNSGGKHGNESKKLIGKGTVGGGKNNITIHTINGNVYLKKG